MGRPEYQATIFAEQIPRRIVVGFVEAAAFNGHLYKSPFVFGTYRVEEINVTIGGKKVPSVRYKLDYTKDQVYEGLSRHARGFGVRQRDGDEWNQP